MRLPLLAALGPPSSPRRPARRGRGAPRHVPLRGPRAARSRTSWTCRPPTTAPATGATRSSTRSTASSRGPGFWERRGLAPILAAAARERRGAGVPRGGGRRRQLVLRERPGRPVRGPGDEGPRRPRRGHLPRGPRAEGAALLGISMGGYAALHIAFEQPGLVAAVATHSAMLLERIPSADQGAGRWHMAAFNKVFGDPIDAALWAENDPLAWARKVDPKAAPALYLDCGAEDRYGLAERPPRRCTRSSTSGGSPTRFELPPGDHGYEFVRAAAREEPALPRRRPASRERLRPRPRSRPGSTRSPASSRCAGATRRCLGGFFERGVTASTAWRCASPAIPPRPRTSCRRRS